MDAERKPAGGEPRRSWPDAVRPVDRPRLLMVEDEPDDAELELHQLRRAGLSFAGIAVVSTLADYVARLEDFHPDVILADYRVPGLAGERSLELALERCPGVPFIIVSGPLSEDRILDLLQRGAWGHVSKDEPSRLGPVVRRTLAEARARGRPE